MWTCGKTPDRERNRRDPCLPSIGREDARRSKAVFRAFNGQDDLEFVSRNPDFVLDGAHNPAGAAALAAYIREFCGTRPVWLVYGAMRDKAIEEVTTRLFPLADRLILTAPDFPRALRARRNPRRYQPSECVHSRNSFPSN